MHFAFTEDQLLFRDAVAELFAKECTPDRVRWAWEDEVGRDPSTWAALAEMGVIGLTVPEAHGGLGMGFVDLLPILTEAGRAAYPAPLLETVAVVAPLLAEVAPAPVAERWLPGIADGSVIATVALDGQPFVVDAHIADLMIVQRDDSLYAVPGASVRRTAQTSVDGARRLFTIDVDLSGGDVELIASGEHGWNAANRAFDRGAAATAAVLVGLAEHMIAMTVAYVVDRKQFGVPIGSFQAVKHHLADAELAVTFARPTVWNAGYAIAHDMATTPREVSMGKCFASDAAEVAARKALQTHGAIGYTTEHDLHFWMKRAWSLSNSYGDAAWHRRRVAQLLLDA
ncbi:MAG: acyl-CoA dehydrogenase [Acidimicrobiia bacterium]|nr:acyl-CoA dehydrogenase [Acidimicrobiia bacterium]